MCAVEWCVTVRTWYIIHIITIAKLFYVNITTWTNWWREKQYNIKVHLNQGRIKRWVRCGMSFILNWYTISRVLYIFYGICISYLNTPWTPIGIPWTPSKTNLHICAWLKRWFCGVSSPGSRGSKREFVLCRTHYERLGCAISI